MWHATPTCSDGLPVSIPQARLNSEVSLTASRSQEAEHSTRRSLASNNHNSQNNTSGRLWRLRIRARRRDWQASKECARERGDGLRSRLHGRE
jgi:hypothetical protein